MNKSNNLVAVLVDDEQNAIENLQILLAEYCPEITVAGVANCVDDALLEIKKHTPDVVFLDIEMPEKTGFEIFKETNQNFKTIFVTAYDEYAIKAFEVSAVDYLLKPINIKRLQQAVDKLFTTTTNKKNIATLQENLNQQEITKITLVNNQNYEVINVADIICIEAKGAYSIVYFIYENNIETHMSSKPLRYFDDFTIRKKIFYRTHRSWLLNIKKIKSFDKISGIVTTEYDIKIPLAKKKNKDFLNLIIKE